MDAIRQINGGLRGLIHKAELATNGQGQVTSNIPGIDLVVKSRLTGDVIETIQVKSNWTMGSLRKTVQDFLDNAHYDESITLAGPRELIEEARALGIPNKLVVVGDTAGNEASGTRLVKLIERGDAAVDGNFTLEGIASKAGQGALVGGAVAATLGSLSAYLAYRRGDLTGGEAFQRVAVEASRGAIAGTALSGVSVLFPPGLLGVGVGIVVGTQIRRVVDIAYGRGAYQDLLTGMSAVEVSFAAAGASIQVVEHSLSARQRAHETVQKDLWETASLARIDHQE